MSCWKLRARFAVGTCLLLLSGCTIRSTPDVVEAQGPVPATVLVLSEYHPGNAFLVDRANRLLLTSLGVAGDKADVSYEVLFPVIEDGKALLHRDKLKKTAPRVKARVIYPDAGPRDAELLRDVAVLQLDSVPEGVPELKLATASPENGASVDLLVAGTKPSLVWNYTTTNVKTTEGRQFFGETLRPINARMIELNLEGKLAKDVNGGPVVNKEGEVVGLVASASAQNGPLLCVDQSELRQTLAGAYRQLAMQTMKDVPVLRDRAQDYRKENKSKEAEEADKALTKKCDEAIALTDKSITLWLNEPRSLYERGAAYSWKNQYDKAIENYNQSLKLDPTVPRVFESRASAYLHTEKYAQAVEDCTEALRLPNNDKARALQLRAQSYRKMKEDKKAEEDEKALKNLGLRPSP